MKFLDVPSLLRLREVSSRLYEVAAQPVLWRCLYAKDFGRELIIFSIINIIFVNVVIEYPSYFTLFIRLFHVWLICIYTC